MEDKPQVGYHGSMEGQHGRMEMDKEVFGKIDSIVAGLHHLDVTVTALKTSFENHMKQEDLDRDRNIREIAEMKAIVGENRKTVEALQREMGEKFQKVTEDSNRRYAKLLWYFLGISGTLLTLMASMLWGHG